MKKIYASMLAVACTACITASAKTYTPANLVTPTASKATVEVNAAGMNAVEGKTVKSPMMKSRAGEEWVVIGTGYLYDDMFVGDEYPVTIEESATQPGLYRIPDAWASVSRDPQPLYINAANPECVNIPIQETGVEFSDVGPVEILSYSAYFLLNGATEEEFIEQVPEAVITLDNNVIMIPERSILMTFPEYGDDLYFGNESDMYILLPGSPLPPQWGEVAKGEMLDGFFQPMFMGEDSDLKPYPVNVQKNNWVEDVYRVLEPWQTLMVQDDNGDIVPLGGNPLVIDASLPSCVVVSFQNSGVYADDRGATYVGNEVGLFYESVDEYLSDPDHSEPWTMDENKMITVPAPFGLFFIWPQWEGIDPNSGKPNAELAWYSSRAVGGYIQIAEFAGISSVSVDNNDAAPVYYNVQGMQVKTPKAGEIYIVKKGNEVSKVVF